MEEQPVVGIANPDRHNYRVAARTLAGDTGRFSTRTHTEYDFNYNYNLPWWTAPPQFWREESSQLSSTSGSYSGTWFASIVALTPMPSRPWVDATTWAIAKLSKFFVNMLDTQGSIAALFYFVPKGSPVQWPTSPPPYFLGPRY